MNSQALIRSAAERLAAAGVEEPRLDAALLLSHVTAVRPLELRVGMDIMWTAAQQERFEGLLRKRCEREPLQYLIGTQPFCGREFFVDERVLIPRPETELLAERAIIAIRSSQAACPQVLDLCCGSGCLAVTMALEDPNAVVCAADLSGDALAVTAKNAEALGAQITLLQGDLWQAVGERCFDIIISNPPYIASDECLTLQAEVLREPMMALDGGADGLDFYRRIAEGTPVHLNHGGTLLVEVGVGQANDVASLFAANGLSDIQIHRDLNDIERMVTAVRT